jgi:hypothetical protein
VRRPRRRLGVVGVLIHSSDGRAHRAVQQSGVEDGQAEGLTQPNGQRPLARRRGPVDGDQKLQLSPPPDPRPGPS